MKVIIDIYDITWDDWNFKATGSNYLFGGEFGVENIKEMEDKLSNYLSYNHSLFNLTINENTSNTHVLISLLTWEGKEPTNIDELIQFIEVEIHNGNEGENEGENFDSIHQLYIIDIVTEEEIEEIEETLKAEEIEYKRLNRTNNQFEKGYGDVWYDLLIGISGAASYDFIKYAVEKIKERYPDRPDKVNFASFDKELMLESVADLSGESKASLSLRRFSGVKENNFSAVVTSRKYKYDVVCDDNCNIKSFEQTKLELERY
ncbi:hypothetical protein [Thalassobacillus pellis]|uniref:hypothetical protein n=1 Tax=Thalassobacillus pellis TaxID=748008 RepID=UPI00195F8220|nr:hypothetical protein [Thalassobacillus pellis]MBM7554485.1 hypothetical protein [Thalassobacillus pellis]